MQLFNNFHTDTAAEDSSNVDFVDKEGIERADSQVAMAIGNIGTFVGGLSSPTFSDTELEATGEVGVAATSGSDSVDGSKAEEEDNYISFEVDGYFKVNYVSIQRSGHYLYKLKPEVGDEVNPRKGSSTVFGSTNSIFSLPH